MRLFVCTWLQPDNQAFYEGRMAELVEASAGLLRAVPRGSAHVTHAFVSRVDDGALHDVVGAVATTASRHEPLSIRLGPPAILFARAEARLVYVPIVYGADAAMQLGADITAELQQRFPGVDVSGSHSPHVTLARFRKYTRRGSARRVSNALTNSGSSDRDDRIAEVQIVSSELLTAGPRYVTLERVSLFPSDF